jgi:CheY-like chemotaxis protein
MLTDQTMPGMTGLELARKVLAARPELPILLMTANREDIPPGTGEPSGIRKIINKPIFLSDLAESMRVALDSPPKPKPVVSESDHTGKKNKAERASPQ